MLACVAVMVDVPSPTMVITFPAVVATSVLELAYVKAPVLLDVGGVGTKGALPNELIGIEKLVIFGATAFTVRFAVIVPVAWVAVVS